MKKKLLIISVILVFLCLIAASIFMNISYKNKKLTESTTIASLPICKVTSEGIISDINALRSTPLITDQSLARYADHRVPEMVTNFSHDGFFDDNRQYFTFPVGETLAMRYCSDKDVVNAWLNSPTHKAVMLDERFDHIGISQGKNITGSIYVVAIFGDMN